MATITEELRTSIVSHTIAIQQDYIQDKPVTSILNSILKSVILITRSDYGFIARITSTHFIPIATSGITCNKYDMDTNLTLSDNFNLFMKDAERIGDNQILKYIPISDNDIIGLISSNKLHEIPSSESVLEPLMIVCKAALKKYVTESQIAIEKESIISIIAHGMRTPLTVLMGSVVMLKKYASNKQVHKEFNKIIRAIEQSNSDLVSTVNDTLDYHKLLNDKIKLMPKSVILQDIVLNVKRIVQSQLDKKNINLKCNISRLVPNRINIDSDRFQQILIDILINIMDLLSSNDSIRLWIAKKTKYLYIMITVSTQNTTIFKQLNSESMYSGINLGLRISKKLIDLFEGTIVFDEDTVTIKLKLVTTDNKIDIDQIFKNRECIVLSTNGRRRIALILRLKNLGISCHSCPSIEEVKFLLIEFNKIMLFNDTQFDSNSDYKNSGQHIIDISTIKWSIDEIKHTNRVCCEINKKFTFNKAEIAILVVDDTETNRMIICEFLKLTGWINYDQASNGKEALDMIKKKRYNIILMDMNMPVVNGKIATMKIHELYYGTDNIPYLIAVTCNDEYIEFYKKYMNDFIIKPIMNEHIIDNVLTKYIWL